MLREQLSLVFASTLVGIASTAVAGLLVVWVLAPQFQWMALGLWYAALGVVLAYRSLLFVLWRSREAAIPLQRMANLLRVGYFATGLVWGSLAVWFFPLAVSTHQMFVILALIGMSAGAISSVSALRYAAACYVLPMLTMLIWRLSDAGNSVYLSIDIAVVLIALIFLSNARRVLHNIEDNISARLSSEISETRARLGEYRYRTLLEQAADGFFLHDFDGRILDVNTQACDSLGYSREELLARNISDIEFSAPPEQLRQFWRSLTHGKRTLARGLQRRKDGSEFPIEAVLGTFEFDGATQIIALVRDVTVHNSVLAALRLREEQARAQFKSIHLPTYIWQSRDDDFVLVEYNDAADNYTQGSVARMMGERITQVYADNPLVLEYFYECYNTKKAVHYEMTYSFRYTQRQALLSVHFAFVPPDLVLVQTDDITQRVQHEQALRESRTSLEDAQRIAHMGSWEWDMLSGRITWTEEIYRILGLESATTQPAQDAFARAMYPDDMKLMEASFARGLAGEREFDDEWRMVEAGTGKIKYVHLRGERFFDAQGGLIGMKGTLQDVTERKQAEIAKSDFISTVSHELRTPLTSIYGALRLLSAGIGIHDPVQLSSMVELALRNADQLTALVNDILELARVEQGRFVIEAHALDIIETVTQAVELNRGFGRHYNVDFVLEAPSSPLQVNADAARITQVMSNLLSNAVKYSVPQSVVDIRIATLDKGVRVSVADRGPGIDEAFLPRLFDRFSRADNSTARSKGGTGLGLSISKAIIDAHAGSIAYEPRCGGGSVFYFELPLCVAAPQ
ncbi:MAG: PAS domain S-box protein [Pseudomonadota bacterium]